MPWSRMTRWKPRFVIEVTTTRSTRRASAIAATMASPFTGRPAAVHDGAAGGGRRRADEPLDRGLEVVPQLAPVAAQEFDPVVLVGVVRRRDDAAQVGLAQADEDGDAGRRDHARVDGPTAAG